MMKNSLAIKGQNFSPTNKILLKRMITNLNTESITLKLMALHRNFSSPQVIAAIVSTLIGNLPI